MSIVKSKVKEIDINLFYELLDLSFNSKVDKEKELKKLEKKYNVSQFLP